MIIQGPTSRNKTEKELYMGGYGSQVKTVLEAEMEAEIKLRK